MNPSLFLALWIGSQTLQLALGLGACWQEHTTNESRLGSLIVSGLGAILPLLTLILFLYVFVFGGSSHVAQMAGPDGFDLWTLWFHAWPLLFFGNPVSFLLLVVTTVLPPYPPRHWLSFTSRLCALVPTGFACYAVATFFPDA